MKSQTELAEIIRQLRWQLFDANYCEEMRAEYDAETEAMIGGASYRITSVDVPDSEYATTIAAELGKVEVREVPI